MESIDTRSVEEFLQPYLPKELPPSEKHAGVFVTATWAQSLDARIAAAPGERTQLSGLYSKKMTHFLRSVHDGILVGKNTVVADDPSLNCRYSTDSRSPRPIILDSQLSWPVLEREWQVLSNAKRGSYLGPWVIVDHEVAEERVQKIKECRGDVIRVQNTNDWSEICSALQSRGIKSLMVEGGAAILDTCLRSGVVSSIIITQAPVFLGRNGVEVSPLNAIRPLDPRWWSDPEVPDCVLAARL